MSMVPDKDRKEWEYLVTEKLKPTVKSFSLQMKLNSVIKHYRHQLVSMDDAISDLHDACSRHYKIYKDDLGQIFN